MTIRAVAWDIDGTLVDSEPLHQKVLVDFCEAMQVDLSDLADDRFHGVHMPDVWVVLADRMPPDLLEADWNAAIVADYVAGCGGLVPILGAIELFDEFARRGLLQVCVSNSGRQIVDANLLALGLDTRLAFSISLDDVTRGKPHPEPYASACRKLGLAPSEVLAIEDSPTGLRSARQAGLVTALLAPTGKSTADADFVVSDLRDLLGLVFGVRESIAGQR